MAKKHQVGVEIKTTADPRGARQAEKSIENVEQAARELREELAKTKGLDPKVRAQIEGVATSMERASGSAKKLSSGQDKATKSQKNSGLAALEFSRAVEDAQYGIRGVLNNLPPLIQFMGGGAGLAGVVSLAAVGLTQLVTWMMKTDEEVKKVAKTLDVARSQIEEFYERAAYDGTAAFRANMTAVIRLMELENQSLRDNLSLTRQKREAQLRVAAAGRDLELATIAGQELTGEISPEAAKQARRNVELSRMRSEVDEKILKAEEELALQQELRAANAKDQVMLEARLKKAKERELELLNERNALQAQQEIADKKREKGEEKIKDSGFFSPGKEIEGRGLVDIANVIFSEEDRQRLVELERVLLPQQENLATTLESTLQAKQREQQELSRSQGAAWGNLKLTEETETQILETQEAVMEAQARTAAIKESGTALKAGLDNLKESASSLEDLNGFQQASLQEGLTSIQQITSDNLVTAEEFQRASVVLQRFQVQFGSTNREFMDTLSLMQETMRKQASEISALKQNAHRISNNSGG